MKNIFFTVSIFISCSLLGALEKSMLAARYNNFSASEESGMVFVEWLESSKDFIQYVDTGIVPTSDCTIYGKYQRLGANSYNAGDYNYLLGGNYDGDTSHSCYGVYSHGPCQTKFNFMTCVYNGRIIDYTVGVYDKSIQELVMDVNQITLNGYTTTAIVQPNSVKSEETFKLFGRPDYKSNQVRIWYFKMTINGEPIIDLVPVRVVKVGYFYDRVTDTLFGVSGEGELTIGPDL